MIRRPSRSTQSRSSPASDVYKRQVGHVLQIRSAEAAHVGGVGTGSGRYVPYRPAKAVGASSPAPVPGRCAATADPPWVSGPPDEYGPKVQHRTKCLVPVRIPAIASDRPQNTSVIATATTTRPIAAQVVLPGADAPDKASAAVLHLGHRMVRK